MKPRRSSAGALKNSVGVFTRQAWVTGEVRRNTSNGASSAHGGPPKWKVRLRRKSLSPYIDTQSDAPAPDEAATKRSVCPISQFVMWPPALQPIAISASGSASPASTRASIPARMSSSELLK